MRADSLNLHGYPVGTKMTALTSHVCSTEEDESKGISAQRKLYRICSTDKDE